VRLRSLGSLATASPRRLLIALGALLVSSAVAIGSGANFNSSSANPRSLITTGSITVTDSLVGQSILNLTSMAPGATRSEAVNITNGGNVPAAFTLGQANLVNVPASPALSTKLTLQVQDLGAPSCAPSCPAAVTVYSGTLGAMGTLALGTFPAGAAHRYSFAVTFPDGGANGADNAYGGASATVDYRWTATQ
jgi:spore coat-associated protein N